MYCGIGRDALDRALLSPEVADDHPHARAVVVHDFGDVVRRDVLIARRGHLERRRQVRPELEPVHPSLRVALRHLLVHDAAARRHPLHVAGAEVAAVAEAVAMLDVAGEHVGDGLDPAVGMPRKAGEIVVRAVVAEVVEQEERIELRRVAEAEAALQLDARALEVGSRLNNSPNRSHRHAVTILCIATNCQDERQEGGKAGRREGRTAGRRQRPGQAQAVTDKTLVGPMLGLSQRLGDPVRCHSLIEARTGGLPLVGATDARITRAMVTLWSASSVRNVVPGLQRSRSIAPHLASVSRRRTLASPFQKRKPSILLTLHVRHAEIQYRSVPSPITTGATHAQLTVSPSNG